MGWVTINGNHVYIGAKGTITKGPAKLVGSTVDDLKGQKMTANKKAELQKKYSKKTDSKSSGTTKPETKSSTSKSTGSSEKNQSKNPGNSSKSGSEETKLNYTKNNPNKVNSTSYVTSRSSSKPSGLQVEPTKPQSKPSTPEQKQKIASNSQAFVKPMVDSFVKNALKGANSSYKQQVIKEAEGLCSVAARRGASAVSVHPEGKSLVITFNDGTQRRAGTNTSDGFTNKVLGI